MIHLREFIDKLRREKDIVEVDCPVDPRLEVAEIHRRVIEEEGPALLFKTPKGADFPLVTNLFGTRKRVEMAFGREPLNFIQKVSSLPEELTQPSLGLLWRQRQFLCRAMRVGFRQQKKAPVTERVMQTPDMTRLPALTGWPEDGGPFLTLPLVHTQGKAGENLGMYRIQIFDKDQVGLHFQIGKGGGFHYAEAESENRPLPVSIYLGGPPALILSAIAPLPENVPELLLAAMVQGQRLGRVKLPQHPLRAVAEAEFCIVGESPPKLRRPEGPFGDHYGYYSLTHDFPVLNVRHIYHRKDAIFPATVVGRPRQEDFYIGDYLQELLGPLLPLAMPGVRDLWSYGETGFHALSAAVVKERYEREARVSMFRILGEGQLSLSKFLLLIDKTLDLRNFRKLLPHVLERVDWKRDLYIFPNLSMDTLDYAGVTINKGSKGVILAQGEPIRRLPETFARDLPSKLARKAQAFCPGCLVVETENFVENPSIVGDIAGYESFSDWPFIVVVDNLVEAISSEQNFLWTAFTRFEPARDIHARKTSVEGHDLRYEGPIVLDARMKPWYPKVVSCDPETSKLVDKRWSEYFPAKG